MPQRAYNVDLTYREAAGNAATLQGFTGGLDQIASRFTNIATLVGTVGAAVTTAFGVSGINTLREYGRGVSEVQALFGETRQGIQGVIDSTTELSATTQFTATSILGSYRDVARAGATTAEALNLVPQALRLSVATATEVEGVTRNLTNTIRAFGFEFSDVARVADVVSNAVNTSNTTFR